MPQIEINIELYCATCGEGICNLAEATVTRTRHEPCFRIEACPKCTAQAREEGHEEGYREGFEAAEAKFNVE